MKGDYGPLRRQADQRTAASPPSTGRTRRGQAIADYPTPIMDNGAAYNDGKVYPSAASTASTTSATAYVYDPDAGVWTPIADMSDHRGEAPVTAASEASSTSPAAGALTARPDRRDRDLRPGRERVATGAENPKPYAGSASAVLGGKMYVVGGCAAASTCGTTDVKVYDPASGRVDAGGRTTRSMSWESCGAHRRQALLRRWYHRRHGARANTYSFDPGTDTWTPIADMPIDLWGAGYAAANGQLMVSGGVAGAGPLTNQGFAYDPGSDAWTALPNSNNAFYRGGGACGFYKIGGIGRQVRPGAAESEVLPGYDQCGAGADVLAVGEPTRSRSLPDVRVTVNVTLDARPASPSPVTYKAAITVGDRHAVPGGARGRDVDGQAAEDMGQDLRRRPGAVHGPAHRSPGRPCRSTPGRAATRSRPTRRASTPCGWTCATTRSR